MNLNVNNQSGEEQSESQTFVAMFERTKTTPNNFRLDAVDDSGTLPYSRLYVSREAVEGDDIPRLVKVEVTIS